MSTIDIIAYIAAVPSLFVLFFYIWNYDAIKSEIKSEQKDLNVDFVFENGTLASFNGPDGTRPADRSNPRECVRWYMINQFDIWLNDYNPKHLKNLSARQDINTRFKLTRHTFVHLTVTFK